MKEVRTYETKSSHTDETYTHLCARIVDPFQGAGDLEPPVVVCLRLTVRIRFVLERSRAEESTDLGRGCMLGLIRHRPKRRFRRFAEVRGGLRPPFP